MRQLSFLLVVCVLVAPVLGQQQNLPFSSLALNADPTTVFNQGPTTLNTFTDSPITIFVRGAPNSAVAILQGPLQVEALDFGTFNNPFFVDIAQTGNTYANQFIVNGFTAPGSAVTGPTANYSIDVVVPACQTNTQGVVTCITQSSFNRAVQALTVDPSSTPFGVRTTGAAQANFTNGYTEYTTGSGGNQKVVFLGGFTFPFYGVTYASANNSPVSQSCFVHADGFISFGSNAGPGFVNPGLNDARTGPRRILTYFSDLEPQIAQFNPSIFSQQFTDANGVRKVRIVHERLAEFANVTGPHGGEVVIDENGGIELTIGNYQVSSSINVINGVARGSGGTIPPNSTAFGQDMTADAAIGRIYPNPNDECFELFDVGNGTAPVNPQDNIGLTFRLTPIPGMGFQITF